MTFTREQSERWRCPHELAEVMTITKEQHDLAVAFKLNLPYPKTQEEWDLHDILETYIDAYDAKHGLLDEQLQ